MASIKVKLDYVKCIEPLDSTDNDSSTCIELINGHSLIIDKTMTIVIGEGTQLAIEL